jgi:hypothetical protein
MEESPQKSQELFPRSLSEGKRMVMMLLKKIDTLKKDNAKLKAELEEIRRAKWR